MLRTGASPSLGLAVRSNRRRYGLVASHLRLVFAILSAHWQAKRTLIRSERGSGGYRVVLFFLWLPSAGMAVARVANRVKQGGHSVPPDDIRRRYTAGVRNLFRLYRPILDGWWLYNASSLPPKLIAAKERDQLTVKQKRLYCRIEQQAENDHEEIN